jgi:hypothetical protein
MSFPPLHGFSAFKECEQIASREYFRPSPGKISSKKLNYDSINPEQKSDVTHTSPVLALLGLQGKLG